MPKPYELVLHLFRRDLRLQDNTALIEALKSAKNVIPCFIFDKRQIELNDYKSDHALQFMANSLHELDKTLQEKHSHLNFFYGTAEEIIANLLAKYPIQAVYVNRDYTPFSRARDQKIAQICAENKVDFHCFADALLHEPEQVLKPNNQPYTVFTHFFNKAKTFDVAAPTANRYHNYYTKNISEDHVTLKKLLQKSSSNLAVKGGRQEAKSLLQQVKNLKNYKETRDFPALDATTKLSAHHKFGTLSARETYTTIVENLGKHHTLINELYWRDFFTHIAHHFPSVFGQAFHKQYNAIKWSDNNSHFQAWREGQTGFPIVDAGMRELNTTGFMHNRVRMITASFLVKDLHIDWRLGEQYFAQQLIDYDPAVNNGNWQWAASTGCDAQPYFRIFNPWLQQQRFDPDCLYIKRWIPELALISNDKIHQLDKITTDLMTNYPRPIVNHALASQAVKLMYKVLNTTK